MRRLQVGKALDLKSSQGILAFALADDASRAACLDKSWTLSLFKTDVRHAVSLLCASCWQQTTARLQSAT